LAHAVHARCRTDFLPIKAQGHSAFEINISETVVNKDQLEGRAKEAKGKVKEVAGKIVGNKTQETKGKVEKSVGKVQKDLGDLANEVEKDSKKGP
jgi:uncharacterized protein YjbJ (UPF0337 family)